MKKIIDDRWIKILETEGKYFFRVYPSNNTRQQLGTSITYDNFDDCKKASDAFVRYVLKNLTVNDQGCITIEKDTNKHNQKYYRYVCRDINGTPLFYQRYVAGKNLAKKGVKSLYNTLYKVYGGFEK